MFIANIPQRIDSGWIAVLACSSRTIWNWTQTLILKGAQESVSGPPLPKYYPQNNSLR